MTASDRSSVAVIGLGTGALACYAKPTERWVFYEIDPLVEKVARDSRYFTHLAQSAGKVEVRLGDGRTTLASANPAEYDLLVLDAFSSDAIPVHLLTIEAVRLYLSRLQPDGILALHISNRYLNLEPLLQAISSRQGLRALMKDDRAATNGERTDGHKPSQWVVMARESTPLEPLAAFGWRPLRLRPTVTAWTDDYSNIFAVIARD